jgi:general secretion pathway protein H
MTTTIDISTRGRGRGTASGFTLIEIMVVIAVVGLISGLGIKGFRSLSRSDLRAASTRLSGTMRFLFDRASTTGKVHRLVLDLENGRYWAEASDDKFFIPRDSESPEALARREEMEAQQDSEDEERRARREKEAAARAAQTSSGAGSFDLSKIEVGEFKPKRARFAAFKELAFKAQTLKKSLLLRSVYTPRVTEPVTAGRAYVYFFPLGQTEPAIVTLSDQGAETIFSLVVHPLTGRVKIYNQDVKPLGVGQRTDDEGNRVQ